MPISVHFGNPRQGKSYAAVRDHVLPGLAQGRHVVTNIEGMGDPARQEKIKALLAKRYKFEGEMRLEFVPHSRLETEVIFPVDLKQEDENGTRLYDDSVSVVKFGTLIVWDEGRAFETKSMPEAWKDALTYHGHWARDARCVDIVIIHQSWKLLAPLVRATSEQVFEFVKDRSGKGYRRYGYRAPGDRDLSRNGKETLVESYKYEDDISALYKTNSDDGPINDNIAVSWWQTDYFKRKLRLIAVLLLVGFASLWWTVSRLYANFGSAELEPSQVAQGAPGAAGQARSVAPRAVRSGPVIVGKVPTGSGVAAVVRDGEQFEIIDAGADGRVQYKGLVLSWPSDF